MPGRTLSTGSGFTVTNSITKYDASGLHVSGTGCAEKSTSGGHAYVRGDYLDNVKPDFLVHKPGRMDPASNLLAVEVKPANTTSIKIVEDIQKLTALRRALRGSDDQPANYQHAIFWLYGGLPKDWNDLKEQLKRNKFEAVDLRLVRCFVHEQAGRSAVECEW